MPFNLISLPASLHLMRCMSVMHEQDHPRRCQGDPPVFRGMLAAEVPFREQIAISLLLLLSACLSFSSHCGLRDREDEF